MFESILSPALIVLVISVVFLLILRNLMLWYWKVDIIVQKMDTIIEELRKISAKNV